jgi:hypothetical protein
MTLRLDGRGEIDVTGTVVNDFGGAIAVAFETPPDRILEELTAVQEAPDEDEGDDADEPERELGLWERVRTMTRVEKLLLAPKATRSERVILLKENDAQVLYTLLKNPRITADEVARIAKSHLLSTATADLIAKTAQWSSRADIRIALVANPRTPSPLALRLLPTLPEAEIRRIAKATAVSQALKQAALRLVINRP